MKKLHISKEDKVLSGVCGGLSESVGVNANVIRGAFIISLFLGFSGLWVYLILMVILPKQSTDIIDVEDEEETKENTKILRPWNGRMIAGVCSGFAKYLRWDVTIIRLVFAISSMVGGLGLILYMIFWFLFPNEEE